LITEADLNNEQSYLLAKNRLHNRFLHGWGVVCGMQVVCGECPGWVTVKTGYALDPCGNDIIVCNDQPFNVIKAIQTCCTPSTQVVNCSPLRYTPSPTCQDAQQQWCITIQYQEQQSRMVTPLQQISSTGSNGGCGGQGGKSGSSSSSSCGGSSQQGQASSNVPVGACEATRINEGFQLGVMSSPQSTAGNQVVKLVPGLASANASVPAPGTFGYQFALCYGTLCSLLLQKPIVTGKNPAQAYQATCSYLTSVRNAFSASYITHCQIESFIDKITIPPPPISDPNSTYVDGLQSQVAEIAAMILSEALCLCTSLLPPCPPDPCDDRLILACVTVQNGKIINICHFGGRQQVVTFPTLYYWLSLFKFDQILADLIKLLESGCCGTEQQRKELFSVSASARENITSAGVGNPAMLNKIVMSFVAQKLGAAMVNAASANPNLVDLRPLVGQQTATVLRTLESYNISAKNITQTDVSSDPAWSDDAVASSVHYAPATFSVTQPLTVFNKGDLVVGFDITNPTDVLNTQFADLQKQVSALTEMVHKLQPTSGVAQAQPGVATGDQK
jgi:hypothetical protein